MQGNCLKCVVNFLRAAFWIKGSWHWSSVHISFSIFQRNLDAIQKQVLMVSSTICNHSSVSKGTWVLIQYSHKHFLCWLLQLGLSSLPLPTLAFKIHTHSVLRKGGLPLCPICFETGEVILWNNVVCERNLTMRFEKGSWWIPVPPILFSVF